MRADIEPIVGRYVHFDFQGRPNRVYFEEAGQGIPLVCVHTAGADGRQLEIWLSEDAEADGSRSLDGEALLTQLLFEDEPRVWDLDRIAGWLGGLAERRTALLTGGKPSAAQFPIRPMEQARLITIEAADLDGDGREELVLRYELTAGNACVFDVLRMLSK